MVDSIWLQGQIESDTRTCSDIGTATDNMRSDKKEEFAGICFGDRVRGSGLKPGKFAEAGNATDGGRFRSAQRADEQRRVAIVDSDVGDKLAAGQDRDVVQRGAGKRLNLEVEMHTDRAGLL